MAVAIEPPARPRAGAPRSAATVLVAVLAVALLAAFATPRAAAAAAGATFTVEGTVRGDDGTVVPDAGITVRLGAHDPTTNASYTYRYARTDRDGRYAIAGLQRPTAATSTPEFAVEESEGYAAAERLDFGSRIATQPGPTVRVDATVRRKSAIVRGRVTVRDRDTAGPGSVVVAPRDPYARYAHRAEEYGADIRPDGSWSVAVPPGTYRTRAQSSYGLPAYAPDLSGPRTSSPTVTATADATVEGVDLSLRARLPGPAYDEYGELQDGYERTRWEPGAAPGRYAIDRHRSVLSTVGPRVTVEARHDNRTWDLSLVNVRITNTGDDVVFADPVAFAGGDRFTCTFGAPKACDPTFVFPGDHVDVLVAPVDPYATARRRFRTTVVVRTLAPAGTHRLPVEVELAPDPPDTSAADAKAARDRLEALIAALGPKASAHAPIPRPGAGGDVGRVLMTKNRLRVTFPGAGTASSTIDRAVTRRVRGRAKRRWRTVRRITLRAASATTRVARFERLARGRYRVRTTYAIGTRAPRATTTTWSIRR